MAMSNTYFVGVDVGTSSARAALVTAKGQLIKQCVEPIYTWNPEPLHYEQSSTDIWRAVCHCVQNVVSDVEAEEVKAISFDATCSLVILGAKGEPLTVSRTGKNEQNVVLWMDHRAEAEAEAINRSNHDILQFVGGKVSLEMQMPKLLWLKNNLYETTYVNIWRAFDLPDFLTWRSTGSESRSLCSVVCKWNFDAGSMDWSEDFLTQINLEELCEIEFEKIGRDILLPGEPVGQGLSEEAAKELHLLRGTVVGTSLIDAHAGALGMFGCRANLKTPNEKLEKKLDDLEGKLALICGTSTCHMSLTRQPCHAFGVWGPYRNAIIPNYYLNEGGQSATGLLLDHVVTTHPEYENIKANLKEGEHIYAYLNRLLEKMAAVRGCPNVCYLTRGLHVWPDFHGNRSPLADPTLKGMISGLNLNTTEESLALLYLATVQALGYGTRHIISSLTEKHQRVDFTSLLFCGGGAKNPLYVQSHADICQLPAVIPDEQEMVLIGSAMLAAFAAGEFQDLEQTSKAMGGSGQLIMPNAALYGYHDRKYKVFLLMLADQRKYKSIMEECECNRTNEDNLPDCI